MDPGLPDFHRSNVLPLQFFDTLDNVPYHGLEHSDERASTRSTVGTEVEEQIWHLGRTNAHVCFRKRCPDFVQSDTATANVGCCCRAKGAVSLS